jgi:DNA-binding CsgD family transcriptional regulator
MSSSVSAHRAGSFTRSVVPAESASSAPPRRLSHSTVGRPRVLTRRRLERAAWYRHLGDSYARIARRLGVDPATVSKGLNHPEAYKKPPPR